ncbi:MAG TPA: acetyl-CoA carboxylase carboxyl transferase subunit alpha, partial [Ignavibacteriales bacterium]|nr:acetyl-CoA carboxylase carboxyl transferase subunit alpha [Ignavibacteriales bacterium]
YKELTRWQRVQLARHADRPYTLDYINLMTTNFIELHGDRHFKDDKAIVGGFANLDEHKVLIIGHQKGRDTKTNLYRNFGMPNPEGYRKALRLMKLAEKFNKPVITMLDTPGAFPGLEAEERGQAEAIARNLFEMSKLKVPIIVVIIGEGASGGALGLGVGDRILMLENCWYSVISPESCSSILWRSWEYKEQAAEALKLTAPDLLKQKIIDRIIPEPLGGAHKDHQEAAKMLKGVLKEELSQLIKIKPEKLVENRLEKFGSMGEFIE